MLAKEPVHQVRVISLSCVSKTPWRTVDQVDGGLPRSTIDGAGSEKCEDDPEFDTSEDDPFEKGFGPPSSEVNFQSSAARFLLKTREERKITQAAVDGIVHDVTDLWQMGMKQVRIVFY